MYITHMKISNKQSTIRAGLPDGSRRCHSWLQSLIKGIERWILTIRLDFTLAHGRRVRRKYSWPSWAKVAAGSRNYPSRVPLSQFTCKFSERMYKITRESTAITSSHKDLRSTCLYGGWTVVRSQWFVLKVRII